MTSTAVMPRHRPSLALGALAGALALDVSGLGVLNAALPSVGARFALDEATLQWVMIAYAVTFAGFLLVGGRLADVFGRRRVFECGVALFTVAALAGAVAPDTGVLLGARAVQGIGAALSGPAALALLTEVFPAGPARNRALSVYAAVGAASFSGGVLLGGVLTQFLGWRSVLWFSVILGLAVLSVTRAGLPGGVGRGGRLDLPGAISGTLGLTLVVVGASSAGTLAWSALCVAVALLVFFVVREHRTADPVLPLGLFRIASVRAAGLAAFLQYMASVGMLFFAPLYLQEMLKYSPLQSGLALVPMSAGVFLTANFVTGRLLARYTPRTLMVVGLVLIGGGTALWMTTPHDGNYLLHVLPGLVISGIGQGLNFPSMTSSGLTGVEPDRHAVAGAVNVVAQQIGASVGVAVMVLAAATVSDQLTGYHLAYLTAGIACVLGAVFIALAGRRDQHGVTT
ncbi:MULTISPECIES: MFS transporter [unclassified Streptomyces]|uniref:MFS transporter n=1 Tax=unclassified Streptomyces TaxID=2593676 RepID=UPI00088E783C|nr:MULTISPECIES: MFS transporter [unclassified Streptomyces]PBC86582.1 putative MFS family arabinose efflux permease [Streptomyces sp. 2321.6]SDQ79393.1 Predicted arabinose efflux permease, MFS family [Streptomyces sp. KS_16]SEE03001.1 Predicted arabinose efflux permease, MFS family [Streptomyces sp. 2133.1]SNC73650.1 Predicted arabinose efflux permease, MFS family [Streptomyces sp. 2114.4]